MVFTALGGANSVSIKFVLVELAPLWAAGARFTLAGLLLAIVVTVTKRPLPRGEQLTGAMLYGLFGAGLGTLLVYVGLLAVPAGTATVIMAMVPLLTLVLGALQRIESPTRHSVAGGLIASAGIVIVLAEQVRLDVPLWACAAVLAGSACLAQSGLVVKRFPPGDPVAASAVGMSFGGALILLLAVITGETLQLPSRPDTWLGFVYLVLPGSVILFVLALYLLRRWTASATSYAFLLFPIVALGLGAVLLDEPVGFPLLAGGAVVITGVYIGAIYQPTQRPDTPAIDHIP